jgi:hypothetical protein
LSRKTSPVQRDWARTLTATRPPAEQTTSRSPQHEVCRRTMAAVVTTPASRPLPVPTLRLLLRQFEGVVRVDLTSNVG